MNTQAELEKEVGTIEPEKKSLEPKKVKIVQVEIIPVGEKKNLKVSCTIEHPDYSEGTIKISSVAYLREKKVVTTGLWFNLDKEDKIQKGTALALFLGKVGVKTLKELEGKEADTDLDGNYLCFKAY